MLLPAAAEHRPRQSLCPSSSRALSGPTTESSLLFYLGNIVTYFALVGEGGHLTQVLQHGAGPDYNVANPARPHRSQMTSGMTLRKSFNFCCAKQSRMV